MSHANSTPLTSASTIVAVSTPPGVGGIAVVRLSGADAIAIAERHCQVPKDAHSVRFSTFRQDGEVVDEVVVTLFRAPHSYTGEDTVEIACHGSQYVQQTILLSLIASGARMAEAGEYTRRAFLNGRLDLSQAEAVADLIDSANAEQHRLAISQLRGGYAHELEELRQQLLELTALIELELDFSQEDVEFADRGRLTSLVATLDRRVSTLRQSFQWGNAIKRGIPVAIVGRPNAGKSSLFNALLHDNRAIVSNIAGTTRDTLEEPFVINGILFRMVDTAGLRHSDDPIEQEGMQRAVNAAAHADIVIYVHDATQPYRQVHDDLQELQESVSLEDKHLLVVSNKMDLAEAIAPTPESGIALSAKEGAGMDTLTAAIVATARQGRERLQHPDVLLSNVRHYEALGNVAKALSQVAAGLSDGTPADLVAIDLRDALHHLGTITGQVTTDEVLGTIFSRFCIGK